MSRFVAVARFSQLSPARGLRVEVEGLALALFLVDGDVHCLADVCPHADGSLGSGEVQECIVICPLHLWRFDVRTGQHANTDRIAVDRYDARIENGQVLVDPDSGRGARGLDRAA
jgi:nitrite reductase (NADH) small subunit